MCSEIESRATKCCESFYLSEKDWPKSEHVWEMFNLTLCNDQALKWCYANTETKSHIECIVVFSHHYSVTKIHFIEISRLFFAAAASNAEHKCVKGGKPLYIFCISFFYSFGWKLKLPFKKM